jgi:hypothetical protein
MPKLWQDQRPGATACNAIMATTRRLSRKIWMKWSAYHQRSVIETNMYCFKLPGERVMARDLDRQVAELQGHAAICFWRALKIGKIPYETSKYAVAL